MGFRDRLRELVYISAEKGTEFRPKWEDLARGSEKKAAVHEIVGSDTASVQDLGNGNQDYPHTLYFFGDDYDKTADAFYDALREKGPATLKSPRWGDLRVLPIKVSQKEGFVDGSRAAVFEVDFIAANDPSVKATSNTSAAIQSAADTAAETVASGEGMAAKTAAQLSEVKSAVRKAVKKYRTVFQALTSAVDSVRSAMETAAREIEYGIDTIAEGPTLLAQSLVGLSRTPARMEASIKAKVDGYKKLIGDSIAALAGLDTPALATLAANIAGAAVAMCEAVTVGTLSSRGEAIAARDALDSAMSDISAAFDAYYTPNHDTLSALEDLRAQASDYLLTSAYSLPSELTMTTDRAYFPLDLAHKLTGNADDFPTIAELNGWCCDMLLVVPPGTEVHYYA